MSDDFDVYGEDVDKTYDGEVQGITDTVSNMVFTDMAYPCLIIRKGYVCPKHKMLVLKNIVTAKGGEMKDIGLYFVSPDGKRYKLGSLAGSQVKTVLDLIGQENIEGYNDDGGLLLADKVYILCSSVSW